MPVFIFFAMRALKGDTLVVPCDDVLYWKRKCGSCILQLPLSDAVA